MLANRVDAVERRLGLNGAAMAAAVDLANVLPAVQQITQELFPGKCEFTHEFDPEYSDDRYMVVNAEATGDVNEIVDRCDLWDERIRQLRPDLWETLQLLIVPR